MKIGIAQMDCEVGNIDKNMDKIFLFAEKAGKRCCDIILFPEMIDTGYNMEVIRQKASTWDEKPFALVRKAAMENKIHIICSLSEKSEDKIYNSTLVMSPDGEMLARYRKNHLADYPPLNEGSCITPGNTMEIVEINGISFGLTICYDLRFPEMNRSLVLKGADVLLLCSAWPLPRLRHWNTLISARAIENQVYFVAANRVGNDGSVTFCGSSRIIDPYGVVAASASEEGEALITGEIDLKIIKRVREKMPVFSHRTELDQLTINN
ncbi:MAG: nitrilase-related carbon-nitrogen hydrolase [Thermodesulfobacteriota bacterium]|nr:nitrilase-related carbon-nitrogen hydrolase [Thermodesulfobacteriota bacterium]